MAVKKPLTFFISLARWVFYCTTTVLQIDVATSIMSGRRSNRHNATRYPNHLPNEFKIYEISNLIYGFLNRKFWTLPILMYHHDWCLFEKNFIHSLSLTESDIFLSPQFLLPFFYMLEFKDIPFQSIPFGQSKAVEFKIYFLGFFSFLFFWVNWRRFNKSQTFTNNFSCLFLS